MRSVDDDEASVGSEVERLRLDELRRTGAGGDEAAVVATVAGESHDTTVVVVGDVDASVVLLATHRHTTRHLTHHTARSLTLHG